MLTPADLARCDAIRAPHDAIAAIVAEVSEATGISATDIMGTRKWAQISAARQMVYYIAHRNGMSLPEIGRAFGRDHTTVLHGINAEKARRGE